jgi:hypothetical protein
VAGSKPGENGMSDKTKPDSATGPTRVRQTAPKSKSISAGVWEALESIPGFNEDLRAAEQELADGRGVRYEVRRGALRRVQPEG